MNINNRLSIEIPAAVLAEATQLLAQVAEILEPYLITLTKEQRAELPKMGDTNLSFVTKAVDYTKTNPEFAPAFVSVPELEKDVKVVEDLMPLVTMVDQLKEKLDDTSLLAGSEAVVTSLAYYNSLKLGVKMNASGAKKIHEDLKQRFNRRSGPDHNGGK